MEKRISYSAALVLLAVVWLLPGVFSGGLESGDETRVAGITAEMVLRNEWIVPRLNGHPFLEYPPLFYLWNGILFRCFGMADWVARFAGMLASAGSAALLWNFVRRIGCSEKMAFWTAFILMSSAQFWADSHRARVDAMLAFFILLAEYGFLRFAGIGDEKKASFIGLFYLALGVGGGVLTKGLIGAVLPAAGIGSYLIADDIFARNFRWKRYFQTAAAFLTGLLPVLLWGGLLWKRAGTGAVYTAFWINNFGRFSGSQGDHASAWWDYLVKLPETFQPYLILLAGGLALLGYLVWKKQDRCALLVLCMLLVPYAVLTAASAKRMVYLLPLAPMAAAASVMFGAWLMDRYPAKTQFLSARPVHFWLILLWIAGSLVNGIWLIRCRNRAEDDEVKQFWKETALTAQRENRPVRLYQPHERTCGAAVFYLRRNVETCGTAISAGPELWIVRREWADGSRKYDRHRALRMPEEQKELEVLK